MIWLLVKHTLHKTSINDLGVSCLNFNPCPAKTRIGIAFANSVYPDQMASEEAI